MLKLKLKTMRLLLRLVLLFNIIKPAASSAGNLIDFTYNNLTNSQKNYWLKLLHYDNFGKSRADGEFFFLAKNGKSNPQTEMEETLKAFKNPVGESGWFKYHPQCVFRERYHFLKELGLLVNFPQISCLQFDEWKKGLNADSITLVFSSSYPNNPSSLFGHTLIRLNQKEKKNDLIDYAVAFSAVPNHDDIGLVFAFKGMFGGYKGLLEVTKYYTKVNDYNNGESRDLIEYDLNMTSDQMDRLINHLWEIYQTTYFDYYFTDENCSAVLVDILAVPFYLDDVNHHQRWYYLPSEMIKVFKKIPGRIKSEHFRASLKKQLEIKLARLSPLELNEVRALSKTTFLESNQVFSKYKNIPVLDGLISLLDFTRYQTKDNLNPDQSILMRKALVRRSVLAQETNTIQEVFSQKNRPDLGHEPRKLSFFSRTENAQSLFGIELKQGYHDLMSNDLGYDPFSQFDFLTGSLVYNQHHQKLNYDQFTMVNLISLHPYQFYDPQFSWAFKVVEDRIYDLDCLLCHRFNARASLGPSLKPNPEMVFTLTAGPFIEAAKYYDKGLKLGIEIEASFLFQITDALKIGLWDEWRNDVIHQIRQDYYNTASVKFAYFPNINNEWRLESTIVSKYRSFKNNTWLNQLNYGIYF